MSGYMSVLKDHVRTFCRQLIDHLWKRIFISGIGLELKMIVSFGWIVTFRCTSAAMRDNAAIDSPDFRL